MASVKLTVPKFGVSTESVAIAEWLKDVGEELSPGDPVVLVETDKATVEIEATVAGSLTARLADVGAELDVGEPYAEVTTSTEDATAPAADPEQTEDAAGPPTGAPSDDHPDDVAPESSAPAEQERTRFDAPEEVPSVPAQELPASVATSPAPTAPAPAASAPAAPAPAAPAPAAPAPAAPAPAARPSVPAAPAASSGPTPATPSARALARSSGLDLAAVVGSGPSGRIRRSDVEEHLSGRPAPSSAAAQPDAPWGFSVMVTVPAWEGSPSSSLSYADLVAAATDAYLHGRPRSRWQVVRVREDGDGLVVESLRGDADERGPGTQWQPVAPLGTLWRAPVDIAVVVSEVPGLQLDVPAPSEAAAVSVGAPAAPGERVAVTVRFDPLRPSGVGPAEAYAMITGIGRLLSSPLDLVGALRDRVRS